MKKKFISITAIVVVAVGVIFWLLSGPAKLANVPDISVKTIDGRILNIKSFSGKPLLVTFWSTTCTTCLQEMPLLVNLYKELNKEGFEIIGIAMYYDPPNRVVELSEQREIPYSIALDIDGSAAQAFGNVQVTPTNILISPDGTIIQQQAGEIDIDQLRVKIIQLLQTDKTKLS